VSETVIRRTHDPALIERILREDSFDAPIPYFPRRFLRRAVRELLAPSSAVYFVVAEVDGEYAGFVLAHTLGPSIWRKFARAQFRRHPIAIASIAIKLKARSLQWKLRRAVRKIRQESVVNTQHRINLPPGVRQMDGPFAWSPERPDIAQLDQFFVRAPFRGRGLASQLLQQTAVEMTAGKVAMIEAHVDDTNEPSLRAFVGAGWEAFRTAGGDFYVRYQLSRANTAR
jgi:GNAT superfamily N-acetyltransferase